MLERVVDKEAEVVREKERERARRVERGFGRVRLRRRAKPAREKGGDPVADPRGRDDGPADDRPERREAEGAKGEVGKGRAVEQNSACEDSARERLQDDAPVAALAPIGEPGEGDHERRAKRVDRADRRRRQQGRDRRLQRREERFDERHRRDVFMRLRTPPARRGTICQNAKVKRLRIDGFVRFASSSARICCDFRA